MKIGSGRGEYKNPISQLFKLKLKKIEILKKKITQTSLNF
jgi:hypothetical protein